MSAKNALSTRGIILLIICAVLAGCASLMATTPTMKPDPCAATKPALNDVAHTEGYFIISDDDMGQLTGYIAALEEGCIPPKDPHVFSSPDRSTN